MAAPPPDLTIFLLLLDVLSSRSEGSVQGAEDEVRTFGNTRLRQNDGFVAEAGADF